MKIMSIAIGTSGYSYPDWRGRFYPIELAPSQWLEYYASRFSTVELNVTFYRLPASPTFDHWRRRTPKDFQFSLKGSRLITHYKRLENIHDELFAFFERASHLEEKLAAILWQLPPRFQVDRDVFENFLTQLQTMQVLFGQSLQVFEFRDPSWFDEDIYQLLTDYGATIALVDWPFAIRSIRSATRNKRPRSQIRQAIAAGQPIVEVPQIGRVHYFRRYGPATGSVFSYPKKAIALLAKTLQRFDPTDDAFVYFTNNARGQALESAHQLERFLDN